MPLFVYLSTNDRKLFFNKLKKEINCSWEKFYPKYKISRASFFFYLLGRIGIPKYLFDKWKVIAKFNPKSKRVINKEKYCKKNLPKIKFDNKLAEIFGVLNGDGHISSSNYEIAIIGNINEVDYSNYLKNLFEYKFKIKFNLKRENSVFTLRGYSSELAKLLIENYSLPKGNKLGKIRIPKMVKINNKTLACYIRGLFDTDGTFYIRREKDPVIEISSADPGYLNEIKKALILLGFKAGIGEHRVFIYNKQDIASFFKEIKPANTKHLKKYNLYLNQALVV